MALPVPFGMPTYSVELFGYGTCYSFSDNVFGVDEPISLRKSVSVHSSILRYAKMIHHRDTESTEGNSFCPIGRRRSGKKTLPFRQISHASLSLHHLCGSRASHFTWRSRTDAFPWPSSPGQGKILPSVSSVPLW